MRGGKRITEDAHAKQLEAFTRPEEVNSSAVSIWERYLNPRVRTGEPLARERRCSPVPRRNTQMWLMASAAGSSKAALVSSICCRFVCKSLPATQQPNIVLWVSGVTTRSFVRFVPVPRVFYALLVLVVFLWSFGPALIVQSESSRSRHSPHCISQA